MNNNHNLFHIAGKLFYPTTPYRSYHVHSFALTAGRAVSAANRFCLKAASTSFSLTLNLLAPSTVGTRINP